MIPVQELNIVMLNRGPLNKKWHLPELETMRFRLRLLESFFLAAFCRPVTTSTRWSNLSARLFSALLEASLPALSIESASVALVAPLEPPGGGLAPSESWTIHAPWCLVQSCCKTRVNTRYRHQHWWNSNSVFSRTKAEDLMMIRN